MVGGLAGNLRRIRELRGLTQEGLADAANVSRGYIASLESARIANPGVFGLYALADTLGVNIEALLGRPRLGVVPRAGYTLSDAQEELEARLELVGAKPFEPMTPEQFDAYVSPALIGSEELVTAAQLCVGRHLGASLRVPAEWSAISFYCTGVLAMALRQKNSRKK